MKINTIRKLFLILCLVLTPFYLLAQNSTVKGTVKDIDGEPIIGASVKVKNEKNATITDLDGNYSLAIADKNAILVFTYVGYDSQEVKVGNQTTIDIILSENAQMLEETVVIGYGTQRRLNVTGSVGTVTTKDLVRTKATTVGATLAGKVPGITFRQVNGQPGQTMRLEIRNMGDPLFIIDGVMKSSHHFNNLDANDIENISILKDGSAAIYGVKAANGVVLVTTKKGNLNEKPTVSINSYYAVQNWTRFPKFSNAYDYTRARSEAEIIKTGEDKSGLTHAELEKWRVGGIDPVTGKDYRSFDWYDFAINENAPQKYLSVSSTGGSDKTTYYLAISRLVQDAVFQDFEFNRSNIQLNLETRISKYLKVGTKINGRLENRLSPNISANYDLKDKGANLYPMGTFGDDFWRMRWGLNQNKPTERPYANDNTDYLQGTYNIFTNQAYGRRDLIGERDNLQRVFQGNWDVEWSTPIKGLKMNMLYSYYYENEQEEANRKKVDFYQYDPVTESYLNYRIGDANKAPLNTGSAAIGKTQSTIWENAYRFSLNYDNKLGDHTLGAIFVAEATERFAKRLYMINMNVPHNHQNFFDRNSEDNVIWDDSYSEAPTAGFIGRVNYNYQDKYLVEVSGRYDGSYLFPVNNRWGFFPSASVGWRISEENFFKKGGVSNWLSNLKLRLSYGEMGDERLWNENKGQWLQPFNFLSGYNPTSGTSVISPDPLISSDGVPIQNINMDDLAITNLSWVKVSMRNVGIDLGFLNNKLSLELDGFYRKRTGLPTVKKDIILPTETGNKLPIENLNSDMHMGFDGFVKWNDRIDKVNYYAGANITFARKKDGQTYGQTFSDSWNRYRNSTYERWSYVNWGYEVIGRFQSQEEADAYPVIMNVDNQSDRNIRLLPGDLIYKDQNGDGMINDLDRRPIGYAENGLPYVTYGLNFGATWNNFDLALDFSGATMQTFQQNYEVKWPFQASGNTFEFMVNDRWHHQDPLDPSSPWVPGHYPALRPTPTDGWHIYCSNSEYWLTNVRYLRLKNLEVGYTLPKGLLQKLYVQTCRFYFNGTNLFSLDNISHIGLDPENNDGNGLGYPNNKVLTLGVNITF